ncbi:MAG: DNA-directed RNA polymerase subunit beta', partial [Victivallales bacterium]|nr:DNA-directed RNA polymerase subunit beta' [Victivallales bacterium]
NEKRMLQEAVDALLDNGRHGRAITGAGNRPLKSLSDMLKGKGGRFRQNLLGKRVDYSGRSVIVVGPELKLDECGIPKKMALTLFEPFIIRHLKEQGHVHTVRSAKKMIERGDDIVWDILEKVTKGHPVMLNRAPTLHRLSIQAFNPVLIEGDAIRIHPLVCTAYNADFDGDQMAVHVPMSNAAQMESKLLMLAPNNIFSPSSGKPITTPSQDITLGSYFLTVMPPQKAEKHPRTFSDYIELLRALDANIIDIHQLVRIPNPDSGKETVWGLKNEKYIDTTVGRCIFNEIWPDKLGFFNDVAGKKALTTLVGDCYAHAGHNETIKLLDKLKDLGYKYATVAGFSISVADLKIPSSKKPLIDESRSKIEKIEKQYSKGVITKGERINKIIDIWNKATNEVTKELITTLESGTETERINPVYAMLHSGARGSKDQIRQLAGMRGLMAKPSGEIIERPILSSFREGLTVLEYFISTHGARKGLADTALKTADSGYMTRKLVDVSQDIICREEDCGTVNGIWVSPLSDSGEEIVPLKKRIIGRYSARDIPAKTGNKEFVVKANEYITEEIADKIHKLGYEKLMIRSPLTCDSEYGICIKCYGRNLASNKMAELGDSLGIIAAQSIGEPGTQLTMRTFHIGGTASSSMQQSTIIAKNQGRLHYSDAPRFVTDNEGNVIVVKAGSVKIFDKDDNLLEKNELFLGSTVYHDEGTQVKIGDLIAKWDPFNIPIISEVEGIVEFRDLIEGITLSRQTRGSGIEEISVMEHREDLHPQIVILNSEGEILDHHPLPSGAIIIIKEEEKVQPGTVLARMPRQLEKTKDITGGLPRVAELLEARRPKELAEIARMSGRIEIGKMGRGKIQLLVHDIEDPSQVEEHSIPANKHLTVRKGDIVKKGQKLTNGSVDPHDLLEICGQQELQEYLVNEVQLVYKAQGVEINDKHIEIIVKQMLQKVRITESGTTKFLPGEQIDRRKFVKENFEVAQSGGTPAEADPVLLGITKASLETESFISAASFQDTTRILTGASTLGKIDELRGFKENVITGHLIPAGTGSDEYSNLIVKKLANEIELEKDTPMVTSESQADKKSSAEEILSINNEEN